MGPKKKRTKETYLNIQKNKEKCCANCTQLEKAADGNYKCCFSKSWDDRHGACIQIMANRLFRQGRRCYDEYNGKNVNNGIRYYNGYPAKLQEMIKPQKN